ncbi:MAG: glutamine--fructose-6-phosphate transaminase (isomerizing) [Candidatus Schekmanbacteria bacterium]|nr:glutamine--fructose-6-phosphate transaminase (isomerizing) [Candidatus Schekmanbacteria bacterium]
MCGIVGYIGPKEAMPLLMEGLNKLSYRGYDSAGVAILENQELQVVKKKGKVAVLAGEITKYTFGGKIGIAHTRWATHGEPSDRNSHPHADCSGKIAVVHNGIIENYSSLKKHLQEKGHKFASETDSEVIAHLIEVHYKGNLEEAVRQAVLRMIGAFAIVVISKDHPNQLIVARQDCPLVIGINDNEIFIASDIPVLLEHTQKFLFLDSGEMAALSVGDVRISTFNGNRVQKLPQIINWEQGKIEKAGYEHFMLKEIEEQPRVVRDTLRGRLLAGGLVELEDFALPEDYLSQIKRIYMLACGTAYHAGLIGEHIFEDLLRIPVEVDLASEFRYRDPILDENTLVIAISQSGETADTLAGIKEAKAKGAKVIAITNVIGSSITREADHTIYTRAGAEIAVASTKAFIAQQIVMFLIALRLSQHAGSIAGGVLHEIAQALHDLPVQIQSILDNHQPIRDLAKHLAQQNPCGHYKYNDFFFLGRGLDEPIAREGALKLREISYIHAAAYAAGELKHGNIALLTSQTPVIVLLTQERIREKMISNIMEVIAREAPVMAVAYEDDNEIASIVPPFSGLSSNVMRIPRTISWLAPILATIPLQLLAYYSGLERGCDVDQPRNLAKSVTVE